jgi:hypothetical protein
MTTHVTETAAAPSEVAVKHFQDMLAFETDCWDVHESLKSMRHSRPGRTSSRPSHVRSCSARYQKRSAAEAPRVSRASLCLGSRQKKC